jgi:hypothetical protein
LCVTETNNEQARWQEKRKLWQEKLDYWLISSEAAIAFLVVLVILLWIGFELWWNFMACDPMTKQERICKTLKMVNDNWKAGLLILIPLFYRTVRMFLEEVQEIAGMKRQKKKQMPRETEEAEEARPPEKQS